LATSCARRQLPRNKVPRSLIQSECTSDERADGLFDWAESILGGNERWLFVFRATWKSNESVVSQRVIGKSLKVTHQRIQQIDRSILHDLRSALPIRLRRLGVPLAASDPFYVSVLKHTERQSQ
jgi:hypothetical protein